MTENTPLPVKGYVGQSDQNVALANEGKDLEERYLRWLDKLDGLPTAAVTGDGRVAVGIDKRFVGGGFRSLTEHIDTATPAGSHKRGPPKGGPFFHFQQ